MKELKINKTILISGIVLLVIIRYFIDCNHRHIIWCSHTQRKP